MARVLYLLLGWHWCGFCHFKTTIKSLGLKRVLLSRHWKPTSSGEKITSSLGTELTIIWTAWSVGGFCWLKYSTKKSSQTPLMYGIRTTRPKVRLFMKGTKTFGGTFPQPPMLRTRIPEIAGATYWLVRRNVEFITTALNILVIAWEIETIFATQIWQKSQHIMA